METGWLIYPREVARHKDNAFGWLAEEAARHGIDLKVLFVDQLSTISGNEGNGLSLGGRPVDELPRFALLRSYEPALSRQMEMLGIPVINTTLSMALCKDKVLTGQLLAAHGIPTPKTIFNHSGEYLYDEVCEILGSPFVMKRTDGAKGEDVFLVGSAREMREAADACCAPMLCQQFIAESRGRDIRVWTVGFRAVAAVERYSDTSFKSNFSLGGNVRRFDLTAEAAWLAEKAARATGVEFAGTDLLYGPDGLMVNEVNGNAGFRTLSRVGENNIPAELFAYIADRIK